VGDRPGLLFVLRALICAWKEARQRYGSELRFVRPWHDVRFFRSLWFLGDASAHVKSRSSAVGKLKIGLEKSAVFCASCGSGGCDSFSRCSIEWVSELKGQAGSKIREQVALRQKGVRKEQKYVGSGSALQIWLERVDRDADVRS